MKSDLIKSRKRVSDYGEVFTAEREVNAMLDLVKSETDRIESKFLEPACGDGNFLVEILRRKLTAAKRQADRTEYEYKKLALIALSNIYGIELLYDNVVTSRERLFKIWNEEYVSFCGNSASAECQKAVSYIIEHNIVHGNTLSTMCVDESGNETNEHIVFSDWTIEDENKIYHKDYHYDKMIAGEE